MNNIIDEMIAEEVHKLGNIPFTYEFGHHLCQKINEIIGKGEWYEHKIMGTLDSGEKIKMTLSNAGVLIASKDKEYMMKISE